MMNRIDTAIKIPTRILNLRDCVRPAIKITITITAALVLSIVFSPQEINAESSQIRHYFASGASIKFITETNLSSVAYNSPSFLLVGENNTLYLAFNNKPIVFLDDNENPHKLAKDHLLKVLSVSEVKCTETENKGEFLIELIQGHLTTNSREVQKVFKFRFPKKFIIKPQGDSYYGYPVD